MKKTVLFATVCGLGLVAAAPSSNGGYPPCSATVTDRCIQLYERGVATPANLALNERLGAASTQLAMGGPYEPVEYEDTAATDDEYAENWSDGPEQAGTDVLSADDVPEDAYAQNDHSGGEWAADMEGTEDWSDYEDQSGY